MFGTATTLKARLARAATLVRAFALLEDPPVPTAELARHESAREHTSQRFDADASGTRPDCVVDAPAAAPDGRPHAHRLTHDRGWRERRAGATPARPTVCLTPLERRAASPQRSDPASQQYR